MARSEWVCGIHTVVAVLEARPESVLEVWVDRERQDDRVARVDRLARQAGAAVRSVGSGSLSQRTGSSAHQGVAAHVRPVAVADGRALVKWVQASDGVPLLLALDGVTDPHNLGACLRTAEAAGASGVVVPRARSAALSPVVRKVAVGAAERVPVYAVSNLARTLGELKSIGLWIYGMDQGADRTVFETGLAGPVAIVLGAEGEGLRRVTRETCDLVVRLPMVGGVESLNVSVAAGICLYEIVRQRSHDH